jgi:hypothetical protein
MKAAALTLLATVASAAAVENVLPLPFPAERYTAMLEKSPFALATPVAPPPVAPTKGFAADWYLTGLARFEDQDYVSIKSRDLSVNFSLFGTEATKGLTGSNESANGVQLVSVEWSNERGKSTVTIKKGDEIARLEFNQAEIQAAAAPVPAAPGAARPIMPGQPGARPVVTPLQAPMPVTGPAVAPHARTAIPRPSVAPVVGQPPLPAGTGLSGVPLPPGTAPAAPDGGDNRRRIRVINPKQ